MSNLIMIMIVITIMITIMIIMVIIMITIIIISRTIIINYYELFFSVEMISCQIIHNPESAGSVEPTCCSIQKIPPP